MRIIAGSLGGLHLKAPKGYSVRPTADQVREAMFNILVSRFSVENIDVLDLFAGTGALGIEALSRGASCAVFVDPNLEAQRTIRANLSTTHLRGCGRLIRAYAAKGVKIVEDQGLQFGGVFIDPPYREGWIDKILRLLAGSAILAPQAWVVVEHDQQEEGAQEYMSLVLTDRRRYGKTGVSFYEYQDDFHPLALKR